MAQKCLITGLPAGDPEACWDCDPCIDRRCWTDETRRARERMTASRALPAWVVESLAREAARGRYRRDVSNSPDLYDENEESYVERAWGNHTRIATAIATEFLRIIEERAGPDWEIHYMRDGRSDYVPLADLLEERDGN